MLVLVPDPVWNTSKGKCSSTSPTITIFAAALMALAFFAVIKPRSWFAEAAEYLMAPNALIKDLPNGNLNLIPLIGKFSIALWVCAPQSAFFGTLTSPRLSCSIRKDCFFVISIFF